MEEFEVRAKSTEVLESSFLIDEMKRQSNKYGSFPVVINGGIRTFHEVRGGQVADDYTLVKLVQRHDNLATTPGNIEAAVYDVQLDSSFLLYTSDVHSFSNAEEFVLALKVDDYEKEENGR